MIKLIRFLTCHSNMFSYISHMSCIFFACFFLFPLVVHLHGFYLYYKWYPRAVSVLAIEFKWSHKNKNDTQRLDIVRCAHCCHTVFMNLIVVRSMTGYGRIPRRRKQRKIDHFIDTYERTCLVGRKHDHETVITAKMLPKSRDHHN